MEYLIGFALIAIIMLCIGFSFADVLMLLVWIVVGLSALTALFFAGALIMLFAAKSVKGEFVRLDEEGRFPVAVYSVGGEELKNVFPAEMVAKKRLYAENKEVKLRKSLIFRAVIDKNALATIIAGAAFFIPFAAVAVWALVGFIS